MSAPARSVRTRGLLAALLLALAALSASVGGTRAAWVVSLTNTGSFATAASWNTQLWTWGKNSDGQSGALPTSNVTVSSAVRTPGPEQWSSVSAGYQSTCGLTATGLLSCWGNNGSGRLGDGTTTTSSFPVSVTSPSGTWSSVSVGYSSTCGVASSGAAYCWGSNGFGELGNGTTTSSSSPSLVTTTGTLTWRSVAAGQFFACGLKTDSTLWCWGDGANGRLGIGSTANSSVPAKVGTSTWGLVATGYATACAAPASGTGLSCWGQNSSGQVGNLTTTDQTSPTSVSGAATSTWTSVVSGNGHTCGLTSTGTLSCWGSNSNGQLGISSTLSSTAPAAVIGTGVGVTTWSDVTALASATCATSTAGALYCWGYNGNGQLGTGGTTQATTPQASLLAQGTTAPTDWTSLAGGDSYVCGVRTGDSSVWCQGDDSSYQMGWDWARLASPSPLQPVSNWVSASSGWQNGCAVRADGQLWCWGNDSDGVNGVGNTTAHPWPVRVGTASTWTRVSMSYSAACGVQSDGSLWCWGYGPRGQHGTTSTTSTSSPTYVSTAGWTDVSVGESHACGLQTGGALYCWGTNSNGELGNGTTTTSNTPLQVSVSGVTWASVVAGYNLTCALTTTSALYCWGDDSSGQIGNGATSGNVLSPTQVPGAWASASPGWAHTCGVKTSGTLWCWGDNAWGELGTGSTGANVGSPTQVGSATTWSQAGAGHQFSCALRTGGSVWCWGYDGDTQLGDRATTTVPSPKQIPGLTASWLSLHAWTETTFVGV